VDEMLPTSKLATLGMQHVLVMYVLMPTEN
jgi:xanthine/uracil permease